MMKVLKSFQAYVRALLDKISSTRKPEVIDGDSLPRHLSRRNLVLARLHW